MSKEEAERCMGWLFQQQDEIARSPFGRGKAGVLEALSNHFSKVKEVLNVKGRVDDLRDSEAVDEKSLQELGGVYDSVKALCDNRKSQLDLISQITSLEDHVQSLSSEVNARAMFLVSTSDVKHDKLEGSQTSESLARADQASILAVRENWKWIFQLMQCAEVHLRNAAAYQEFFQEAEVADYWMNTTLAQLHQAFDRALVLNSPFDGQAFLKEINDILAAYLKWQTKIDYLFDKSRHVVPVHQRVKPLTRPRPVLSLVDYKTDHIEFSEGDTVTLVDNSDKKKWKVRTDFNPTEVEVLAVVFLMTPPCSEAIDFAIRLRIQMLERWTTSVKYIGQKLITILLLVFKNWTDEEVKLLKAMSRSDKQTILGFLRFLEDTLQKHWGEYGDYKELQIRINRLRTILEESSDQDGGGNSFSDSLVVQVKTLEELLNKYKDFWSLWETFKCVTEMLKQPKFLLVCDKWEQLRFVTSAEFVKFWETRLDLSGIADEEKKEEGGDGAHSEISITDERQQATTDTVSSTLEEQQHTYIIKSILDPRDDRTQLTVEEAVNQGVLDKDQKNYINPKTGKSIPMVEAMSEGRVLVDVVSRKKIREENNSYGLITITITREVRPYTIKSIIDPVTEEKISQTQATVKNILNSNSTTYRTETGDLIPILDAISSGLVTVKYEGAESDHPPEVVTKTYLVYGVIDQKKKQKVSFSEAVKDGLLDGEAGEYVNNVTNERISIYNAILKGFIKARIAQDPSKLEINPENTIVVEKLSSAKSRILKSVKMTKAFGK
jgi:hypothetical protein